MYKSRLQELCQRRSWDLPEYTIVKDGPDHTPRFKAIAVVNGLNFETPAECKSTKDAQNTVARIAFDFFNRPPPPPPPLHPSAVIQPLVPASSPTPVVPVPQTQAVAPVSQLPQIPVPVAPLPSSLPLPPPGLLAPNNSAHVTLVSKDMMQPSSGDMTQTSHVCRGPIGSNGTMHMYKNLLQQHAQKNNLSLPVYTCESEGPPHARHFRSRVSFDGKSYETVEFFTTLKEAEHAAAKVACQMLPVDQIQEDVGLYKNLLQELAQKRGLLCPTYETVRSGPPHRPIFVSKVEVGSSTFQGDEAKTKKQAEMNAATVAYGALLKYSHITGCSKAPSSMECVADDLMQDILIETMKRDEVVANEESPTALLATVLDSKITIFWFHAFPLFMDHSWSDSLKEQPLYSKAEINAKRIKCSPENETANWPALSHQTSPLEGSSVQVEHEAATDPVAEQPIEAQRTFCSKTVVFPRKSNFPIPEGASVMPYSDDQWVAYKVELNPEPLELNQEPTM